MAIFKTVGTLAQGAVHTAASAARHPLTVASQAAGLVRDTAEVGVGLVRNRIPGGAPKPAKKAAEKVGDAVPEQARESAREVAETVQKTVEKTVEPAVKKAAQKAAQKTTQKTTEKTTAKKAPAKKAAAEETAAEKAPAEKALAKKAAAKKTTAKKSPAKKRAADPRDKIPGPDLATFEPPAPEDLPEPIVIVADDEPGEAFQTEPKASTRTSARGGTGDREENSGYVEEIPTSDVDIETPVGTTGAEVGTNPDTAESDLQQPGTPPIADPAVAKAVTSESEVLRKAAEGNRG